MSDATQAGRPVTGFEVYSWPEFRAFARRLGVPDGLRVVTLLLSLTEDSATYSMTVQSTDESRPEVAAADAPVYARGAV